MAKTKKPIVSVIIPTRNRLKLLKQSLNSVLNQTYPDLEIIIIDDASQDKTPDYLKSIKDKRVKHLRLNKHQGPAKARNFGLKKTKGKFIAFNDDDDLWHKEKIKEQVQALTKANKETGIVYVRIERLRKGRKEFIPDQKKRKKQGKITQALLKENFIGLPSVMIKRDCLKKTGLFDEEMPRNEDWEWFVRLSQNYHFLYLPQILVESPILPGGITENQRILFQANDHFFKKHQQEIKKDKETLARWQFSLGDAAYHLKKMKKARNHFLQAFKTQPTFKHFRAIIKTILGKKVSETIISAKIKLIEEP